MHRRGGLVLCLLLAACAPYSAQAPVGDHSQRPVSTPAHHRVRQGDTLYSVSFLYGYSVDEVAAWNRLRPPYTIYKGQQLRLRPSPAAAATPKASVPKPGYPKASQPKPRQPRPSQPKLRQPKPSQPKTSPSTKTASQSVAATPPSSKPKTTPSVTRQSPAGSSNRPVRWSWPVGGRLISRYNPESPGKKGINIAGKAGESVRAAAAGKIVYAGSGLSGYGRLIIIKHNKDFLSAYAHNRKLIAREGQWVEKGEVIAHMGSSATDRAQLHFEIRKRGRPVDPLRYLPKR